MRRGRLNVAANAECAMERPNGSRCAVAPGVSGACSAGRPGGWLTWGIEGMIGIREQGQPVVRAGRSSSWAATRHRLEEGVAGAGVPQPAPGIRARLLGAWRLATATPKRATSWPCPNGAVLARIARPQWRLNGPLAAGTSGGLPPDPLLTPPASLQLLSEPPENDSIRRGRPNQRATGRGGRSKTERSDRLGGGRSGSGRAGVRRRLPVKQARHHRDDESDHDTSDGIAAVHPEHDLVVLASRFVPGVMRSRGVGWHAATLYSPACDRAPAGTKFAVVDGPTAILLVLALAP